MTFILTGFVLILFFNSCSHQLDKDHFTIAKGDSIKIARLKNAALLAPPDSALKMQEEIKQIAEGKHYTLELFYSYCALALINNNKRANKKIITGLLDSAGALIKDKPELRSYLYTRYGIVNRLNDSALYYYKLALSDSIHLAQKDKMLIYANLALLFLKSKSYTQAEQYGLWALNENRSTPSPRRTKDEISHLNNLYLIEKGLGDSVKAGAYLRQAARLVNDSFGKIGDRSVYQNMGKYYLQSRKPDSALYYFQKFNAVIERDFTPDYRYYPMLYYAQVYLQKNDLTNCNKYLNAAATYIPADEIDDYVAGRDYFETLYQLKKAEKADDTALLALEKRNKYNELLYRQENNEQILNYEKQLKQAASAKELSENEQKLVRQKQFSTALGIVAVLLAIVAALIYVNLRRKKMLETQKWAAKEQETAFIMANNLLQQQVEERKRIAREMHDELGSTLTSISLATGVLKMQPAQINTQKPIDIIARASDDLGIKINEIVWSLNVNNDNMESLAAYIRNFCATFLAQASIDFHYTATNVHADTLLTGYVRRTLYHTTKELINNIVKHANATRVLVSIAVADHNIRIIVQDNGTGMPALVHAKPGSGNGLRNMQYNMEQIRGSICWENDHGLKTTLNAPIQ